MLDMARLGSGIPLVARDAELARLRAALQASTDGSAGAVLISGDAGVGKSRLLEEIIALADGHTVLSGRCVDVGATGLPYLPFAEILTAVPDQVAARPVLGRLLPGTPVVAGPAAGTKVTDTPADGPLPTGPLPAGPFPTGPVSTAPVVAEPAPTGSTTTGIARAFHTPVDDASTGTLTTGTSPTGATPTGRWSDSTATDNPTTVSQFGPPDAPGSRPLWDRRAIDPFTVGGNDRDVGTLQLFDAMLGTLLELAARKPVLLTIEDLHWADGSTRALFSYLLARLRGQRILVVATYRSDDLHRRHPLRPVLAELLRLPVVDRLDLEPLPPQHSERFVAALTDEGLGSDAVREIARRSEGNPFFAEELVAAANEQGGDSNRLPWTLSEVLLTRVERLTAATQQLLRAASVAGRRVHGSRLHGIVQLSEPELEEALREALAHHVLVAEERDSVPQYAFRHALLAEAVYADLLPSERVRLHTAYADLLAGEPGEPGAAAELAYHAVQSNDLRRALAASVDAAMEATRAGAPAEALRHLEQALQLWNGVTDPELCCGRDERWLLGRAREAAASSGDPERAIAYGRSEVRAADAGGPAGPDPLVQADARQHLARHLLNLDGYEPEALRIVEAAWDLIADVEPTEVHPLVLSVRAELLRIFDRSTDPVQARESAEDAVRIARIVGSARAEAEALITLAIMSARRGEVDQACELLRVARGRAVEAGALAAELRAVGRNAMYRLEHGELAEASRLLQDGLARAAQYGLSSLSPAISMRVLRATLAYFTGDFEAALTDTEPGGPESDLTSAVLGAVGLTAWVARGEFDAAEEAIARFRTLGYGDLIVATTSAAAYAELHCWRGRPDAAVAAVEEGLRATRELSLGQDQLSGIKLAAHGIGAYADLARRGAAAATAIEAGERLLAYARNLAETLLPGTGTLGPEGRAWLERARAEATRLRGTGDPDAWRRAVEGFGFGHVYEQALARRRLAEALLDRGDRDAAAVEITEALAVADRIGAVPLAEALRELARRARIVPGRAGSAGRDVGARDVLTPRELTVLREVANGGTNKQIGATLYISEKTVSVHLSRVMAKLQASSRTEAVTIAYRRGLL